MEQERGQRGDDEHERQRLQRQHESPAGRGFGKGQRSAAQIAEHERRARARGVGHGLHRHVEQAQRLGGERDFQEQQGGGDAHGKGDARLAPIDRAAVLRQSGRDRQQRQQPEGGLQPFHQRCSSGGQ
jgi:hypothetical protein